MISLKGWRKIPWSTFSSQIDTICAVSFLSHSGCLLQLYRDCPSFGVATLDRAQGLPQTQCFGWFLQCSKNSAGYGVGNTCVPSKHLSHCTLFQPEPQLKLTFRTDFVVLVIVFPLSTKAGVFVGDINTLGALRARIILTWTFVACYRIERFKIHFETNNTQQQAPTIDVSLISKLSF